MALVNPPPSQNNVDLAIGQGWQEFFYNLFTIVSGLTQSGFTSSRPNKFLWTGRPYFDTTLNIPIWYNGANWVNASGAIV